VLVTTPATAQTPLTTKVGAQVLVALLDAAPLVPAQTTMIVIRRALVDNSYWSLQLIVREVAFPAKSYDPISENREHKINSD
jgi:hypothetical protein